MRRNWRPPRKFIQFLRTRSLAQGCLGLWTSRSLQPLCHPGGRTTPGVKRDDLARTTAGVAYFLPAHSKATRARPVPSQVPTLLTMPTLDSAVSEKCTMSYECLGQPICSMIWS